MDLVAGADNADGSESGIKRACDQCRVRKIRCDKESPCSNCKTAQRQCSSSGPGQKPKETRQRVLISTQYERKIDYISERLSGIENLLRTSLSSAGGGGSSGNNSSGSGAGGRSAALPCTTIRQESSGSSLDFTPSHHSTSEGPSIVAYGPKESNSIFEGDSSLAAHTVFASELLEHAVDRTALRNSDISSDLQALRQIVSMKNPHPRYHEARFPYHKPQSRSALQEAPMPPMPLVVALLRDAQDEVTSTFPLAISIIGVERFSDYCRRVYFATDNITPCLFIIVNAGLSYLLQETIWALDSSTGDDSRVAEFQGCANSCRQNVEHGLASLTMFLPASRENIEAMVLGAHWSVELAKPTLAWQMTTTACSLCQTLGYHRATMYSDLRDDDRDQRLALFWQVYILDRSLALRLGRAATLKDHDITAPREVSDMPLGPEWVLIINTWIRQAEIQGNIYDHLYSPAALRRPDSERIPIVWDLAEKLKALSEESAIAVTRFDQPTNVADSYALLRVIRKVDDVSLHSLLTLVYRALPPLQGSTGTFSPHSIEAARGALQVHYCAMTSVAKLNNEYITRGYLNWRILNLPFIPFIVLFCHVVETANMNDLECLSHFVTSLENSRTASDGSERLYKLCHLLSNIATHYVQAKQEIQTQGQPDVMGLELKVDGYLSALGFMPPEHNSIQPVVVEDACAGGGGGGGSMVVGTTMGNPAAVYQTSYLGDWFSGGRHMMGLLEEDVTSWSGMDQGG